MKLLRLALIYILAFAFSLLTGCVAASSQREKLAVQTTVEEATYTSPWLKVAFSQSEPKMTFLSVDATGEGRHSRNLLKSPVGVGPVVAGRDVLAASTGIKCTTTIEGNRVRYSGIKLGDLETDAICFTVGPKSIGVKIDRDILQDYAVSGVSPLRFMFDATVTPAAPLGRVKAGELGTLQFPVLLHFPDWGSLLVRAKVADGEEATWHFSLLRDLQPIKLGAVAEWRDMTPDERKKVEKIGNRNLLQQNRIHLGPEQIQLDLQSGRQAGRERAGKQCVELEMTVTAIYPEMAKVDADPKLIGIKRAWLNLFGLRADLGCLANNSTGDTCQFCMHCYADQAYHTPPLFDDFTALDLVGMSLDRYFDGFKGYSDHFQDVAPSTVIAAWVYATGKPDPKWLARRIADIEKFADRIIAQDKDGDGLAESEVGPSNWWDCVDWNGKDAYSSALAWRAFRCMADLEHRVGNEAKAKLYWNRADRIKAIYYTTFYNPETGVLAGWRTLDGKLRDSHFLWANGIAISYGLVDKEQANAILDRLQAKIKEVGFTNFQYGLPGNLTPFPHFLGYQLYENGGVTGSMAYYYVQALYTMGRTAEADAIFDKMLEGYRDGTFQNGIGNGGDWKEWNGTPCGYEGLLSDAYYPLSAWITGRLGRGVPIPDDCRLLPARNQGQDVEGIRMLMSDRNK